MQNAQGIDGAVSPGVARPQSIPRAGRLSQRRADPADNDFLRTLFAESRPDLALLPEAVRGQLIRLQFESQSSQYCSLAPDAVDWILQLDRDGRTEPVGRCYLDQGPAEHRLLDLAIRPEWRGQGLGSAVLRRLCDEAGQAGVPLRLSVWRANQGAIRLYRRHGFGADGAEAGTESDSSEMTGYLHMHWSAGEMR
ncbi:MAG TPA: GNAT family N-acetyltransferase [Jatrophihabitans sp.]|nr:GNAT family N-acetyltransferase [Jatrophihabitans sp.]